MAWLTFQHKSGSGDAEVEADRLTIGRSPECDVVLADPTVSRIHVEIRRQGDGWRVVDRSRHGTRLNGTPIAGEAPLAPGDRLDVGRTALRFEERRVPLVTVAKGERLTPAAPVRAVGYWFDGFQPSDLPVPELLIDAAWDARERTAVAAYLRSGAVQEVRLGQRTCRLGCGVNDGRVGDSDLTDGVWIWPEALAHHVQHHGVRLPPELIEHTRKHTGPAAPFPDDCEVDFGFWIDWARGQDAWIDLSGPWRLLAPGPLADAGVPGRKKASPYQLSWGDYASVLERTLGPEREQAGAQNELRREIGPDHPLSGCEALPVARRDDRDDVLFYLPESGRLAIVNLTWSARQASDPTWPHTTMLGGWNDWNAFRRREDTA